MEVACKCKAAAREVYPKCAGDLERDLQSLGPVGSRLHSMTGAVCATRSAVVGESCLSWAGQDRTSTDDRRDTCTWCVMDATRALQAGAHGFAVGKLDLDTYDKVPPEGSLGWRFVGWRHFGEAPVE